MRFVTKALPISSIDSKWHIKKLKSNRTCLIGYSGFISHEWFLIAWGTDTYTRAHTQTRILTSARKQFQETRYASAFSRRVPGLKTILECL